MSNLAGETLAALILVVLYLLFSVYITKFSERYYIVHTIHESGLCILIGMLVGGIILWTTHHPPHKFETSLFFHFMLPFLYFGIGYNMKRRRFFRHLGPIALNGIVGTLINFILISVLASAFVSISPIKEELAGINLDLQDALALGAVLSCSETVVTLSVIKETSNPKLNSIIFGESLIGNAVSILLVNSIKFVDFDEFTGRNFFWFCGVVLYSLFGSVILGIILGLISALLTKNLKRLKKNPSKEVALQFYIAWTGYILSTMVGCSGVLTILVCAIITSHYSWYNMEPDSKVVVIETFRFFGEGARALIFGYLGLTSISYPISDVSPLLLFLLLLSMIATRFISIFGLALIIKLVKKSYEYTCKQLAIIWLGGLFRGSIAFALIISISTHHKDMIRATVLFIIVISMIGYTLILPFWYRLFAPTEIYERNQSIMEALADGYYRNSYMITGKENYDKIEQYKSKRNWFHRKWREIDNNYLKPCLIDNEVLKQLKENKMKLDEIRDSFTNSVQKKEETELSEATLNLK